MKQWLIIMTLFFQSALLADFQVIILLGPPGVGKGTHAAPLSENLHIPHISTGDLFRKHLEKNTYLGKKAKKFIQKGELVPDSLVIDILFERISKSDCKKGYILDGFPRTIHQAKSFEKKLKEDGEIKAIHLSADSRLLIERITGRLSCKFCGAIFHKTLSPPKKENICDHCGEDLYQRKDDTEEVFTKRLQVYYNETNPLIDYYRQKGNFTEIEVKKSQSKEEIFQEILSALEEKVSV